MDDKDDLTS